MALVTKEFKLDLAPGQLRPVVNASQGDIGGPFKADLYWNGSPWTATGYTAKLRGKKPDKTVFEYTATVSGSSVTFSTTEQMTIISGQSAQIPHAHARTLSRPKCTPFLVRRITLFVWVYGLTGCIPDMSRQTAPLVLVLLVYYGLLRLT